MKSSVTKSTSVMTLMTSECILCSSTAFTFFFAHTDWLTASVLGTNARRTIAGSLIYCLHTDTDICYKCFVWHQQPVGTVVSRKTSNLSEGKNNVAILADHNQATMTITTRNCT